MSGRDGDLVLFTDWRGDPDERLGPLVGTSRLNPIGRLVLAAVGPA